MQVYEVRYSAVDGGRCIALCQTHDTAVRAARKYIKRQFRWRTEYIRQGDIWTEKPQNCSSDVVSIRARNVY